MTDVTMKSIAAKIRALLSKTVENGCTEAEAMLALEKARKMMDENELNTSEIELRAEGTTDWHWLDITAHERRSLVTTGLWSAIRDLCGVKVWNHTMPGRDKRAPRFFGFAGDMMFAEWLARTLSALIVRDATAYYKGLPKEERNMRKFNSFIYGMGVRIAKRIKEEVATRDAGRAHVGTGLVVIDKQALVEREFKNQLNIKMDKGGTTRVTLSPAAHEAGRAAGDRATWSRPVNNGGGVLAIGAK